MLKKDERLHLCPGELRALLFIVFLSAALCLPALGARSLWPDELFSAEMAQRGLAALWKGASREDIHPPLYYMLLRLWALAFGGSEVSLRLPSVAAALASLPLAFVSFKVLAGSRTAILATFWLATSPFFVLYSRMARYYSLALLLGLASFCLFLQLLEGRSLGRWLGYVAVSAGLLYTDYPACGLLLAQNLYLLFCRRALRPGLGREWLGSQLAIGLLYLPWVVELLKQVAWLVGSDKVSVLGGLAHQVLRLAFPFYSFSLGETIYPWSWPAFPALLFVGAAFVLGLVRAVRWERPLLTAALFLFVSLGFVFLIAWLVADVIFVFLPARAMFAAPFFYLLAAAGMVWLAPGRAKTAVPLLLALIHGYSLGNYYTGRQFVNPVYVVPTREVVAFVVERSEPGDILAADRDTGFLYYYERMGRPGDHPYFPSQPAGPVVELASQSPQARIWLFTYGRDRSWQAEPTELLGWLEANRRLAGVQGYVEQEATYLRLKGALSTREPYRYKALLRLYVPPGGPG